MLRRGDVLDGVYQIIEEIGAGGTGIIYKAYHLRLGRYVVVKKIKDEVAARINARTEADILKRLKHTYLPQVYDFLEVGGGIYTVIDFIEGQSLDYYIKNGYRIEQKQLLLWAKQLCEALVYLHAQTPPIIHSDIKPQNIMITPQGNVCLIDFNISLDGQGSSQVSGLSAGYAPPEQYPENWPPMMGMGGTPYPMVMPLDARSDIYSLGATFYHLMTGVKPEKSTGPVTPISVRRPPYSQAFVEIVEKMMQPDPNRRYQTAAELLGVLTNIRRLDRTYIRHRRKQHTVTIVFSILMTLSVLVSVTGFLKMGTEQEAQYASLVEQGKAACENGDYEAGLSLYDQAINLYSTKLPAYYEKLLAYVEQGEYLACVQYGRLIFTNPGLTKAMEADPVGAADLYYMIANAWFEQENYAKAVGYYEEAVLRNSENPDYYRDYAISLARMQQVDEAQQVLSAAKNCGMDNDSVTLVEAELLLAEGDWQQASERFENVFLTTQNDTTRYQAYLLCARAYRTGGKLDEEIEVLEQARSAVAPNRVSAIVSSLAQAYMRRAQSAGGNLQADCEKALECYETLKAQGNDSTEMRLNTAFVNQLLHRYEEAEQILTELKAEAPDDYRPYMRLALLYGAMEDEKPQEARDYTAVREMYEKAVAYYEQARIQGVSDEQMQVLETMMQQIIDGGWIG